MFRKYPSIEQFRHIIRQVKDKTYYVCTDISGEPYFDYSRILPVIKFIGTVKLHGTNACVGYKDGEIFTQSRNNIITIEKDNAGFAKWVEDRKGQWIDFFKTLEGSGFISEGSIIYVYGEFVGKKIQKGVGISNIERSFFIFDIMEVLNKNNVEGTIVTVKKDINFKMKGLPRNTYNIYDFKVFELEIDFNKPEEAQNRLAELTMEVENKCPVASVLLPDFDGELIGEGIVWRSECGEYIFKTKGEKHSKPRVKTAKELSNEELEKLNKVEKCVEEVFSPQRCNQALIEIFGIDFEDNIDIRKIGDYFKWVMSDTKKEEYDVIEKYGLEFRDISRKLQNVIKQYFMGIYNKDI